MNKETENNIFNCDPSPEWVELDLEQINSIRSDIINQGSNSEVMDVISFNEDNKLVKIRYHLLLSTFYTKLRSSRSYPGVISTGSGHINDKGLWRPSIFLFMSSDSSIPEYRKARYMLIEEVNMIFDEVGLSKIPHNR